MVFRLRWRYAQDERGGSWRYAQDERYMLFGSDQDRLRMNGRKLVLRPSVQDRLRMNGESRAPEGRSRSTPGAVEEDESCN